MINGFVYLDRKFHSKEEFEEMFANAKKDRHGVFVPTHPIRKNGRIVGYFSIGSPGVPLVFAWLSTQELLPRESFTLINTVENHVALAGATGVVFPVQSDSPFHPLMESMGFKKAGNYDIFVKEL